MQTGIAKGKPKKNGSTSVPYLRVANVQDGYVDLAEVKRIEVDPAEVDRYRLRRGDVLFTEGGDFDKLGRGTVWRGEIEPCLHQNHVFAVRPHEGELLPEFLAYLASSQIGRRYFISCSKQSTNLASINSTQLRQFPIPLPSFREQRCIADILVTWDKAIDAANFCVERAARLLDGLLTRLLDRCVDPGQWHTNGLARATLGEIFAERDERGYDDDRLLAVTGSEGVIDRAEIERRDTSSYDKSNYKLVLPGDIAYNTMRMWQGVGGLCSLRGIVSPAYTVVTPIRDHIEPEFAAYLFKVPRMIHRFHQYSQGLVDDTLNLKYPRFSEIQVATPTIHEQRKVVRLLDVLSDEIRRRRREIEALRLQRNALATELLNGRLRVRDAAKAAFAR